MINNTYEILKSVLNSDSLDTINNEYECFKAVYSEEDGALRVNVANLPEGGGGLPYEKVEVEMIDNGGSQASYSGIPNGCTTTVTITANNEGTIGNITIGFDGVKTISSAIAVYNASYPLNQITLTNGDGSQIPANKFNIVLSGGEDGTTNTLSVNFTLNSKFIRVTLMGVDGVDICHTFAWLYDNVIYTNDVYNVNVNKNYVITSLTNSSFNIVKTTGLFQGGTYTILIEKLN